MQQQLGNILELAKNEILCFTTNGNTKIVKDKVHAVMGKGIAKEIADAFPHIPEQLGECLADTCNHVYCMGVDVYKDNMYILYSFPTKLNWWEKSSFDLIEQSCKELVKAVKAESANYIYIPRPGCGNGGLNWEDVKPILEKYLDDRFIIVSKD
jgi:hypothetical protein